MTTVYKYELQITEKEQVIETACVLQTLHVGFDPRGVLCLWALVDVDAPKESTTIKVVGTGWPVDGLEHDSYLGSVNDGPFVWHVFAGRTVT